MNFIIKTEAIGKQGRERVMEGLEEQFSSGSIGPMVTIHMVSDGVILEEKKHFFQEITFSSPD